MATATYRQSTIAHRSATVTQTEQRTTGILFLVQFAVFIVALVVLGSAINWPAPTVALAWALGWAVTRTAGVDLAPRFTNFGSTSAWAFQLVTGLVLVWIDQHRLDQLKLAHR